MPLTLRMDIRVFELDGTEIPVTVSAAAQAYLDGESSTADTLRLVTIADYTLIANTGVNVKSKTAPSYAVMSTHDNFNIMASFNPPAETYHRAKEDTAGRLAGYYKYVLASGDRGFASFLTRLVTTNWDDPADYWDDWIVNSTNTSNHCISL